MQATNCSNASNAIKWAVGTARTWAVTCCQLVDAYGDAVVAFAVTLTFFGLVNAVALTLIGNVSIPVKWMLEYLHTQSVMVFSSKGYLQVQWVNKSNLDIYSLATDWLLVSHALMSLQYVYLEREREGKLYRAIALRFLYTTFPSRTKILITGLLKRTQFWLFIMF